ncbi:MAG: pseudouridine synthase [Aquabacterium sp.]|uniref:pseudouridine synthase n=1 Tax=Aquabacterium sp. TaxID=1872578 RepID=UPI003BAFBBED
MTRPARPPLPTRDGVSPSSVSLPSGPWSTVLDFLAERLPAVSRTEWQARMHAGNILDDDGLPVLPQAPYRPQTRLHYWRALPFEHTIPFHEDIVFMDEHLVIADKPHFLPITPKGRYVQETLLVRLKRRLGIDTLVPIHRLDRETAGLIAFTVQPHERNVYQALFRERAVHKVYEAVAPLRADLALPLNHRSRLVDSAHFMAMEEAVGEPNSETLVELQQARPDQGLGLYRLSPHTGKRHQLRAHMHALSIPIVNDRIYPVLQAADPLDAPDWRRPLQLLARHLAFDDPVTGQRRSFTSRRSLDWPPSPPPDPA